jgi:hypothetical protein
VEHACQNCGALVEDGRPFCPQCRAPQIQVKIADRDSEVVTAGPNPAPDEFSPEAIQPGRLDLPLTIASATMDRGSAVRAALKAGVLGVFIQLIPFLGIVLTGAVAVFFYRRENGFTLPAGLGSRLGAAAGVVAFAVNSVLILIRIFVFHGQHEYTEAILRVAQNFGANVADPELQASIRNLFTPAGLALTFFFGMIITLALASLGGALAALFLRPRNPRV